jgi:predicted  nucleic acid-binding Zn-ribbon protein
LKDDVAALVKRAGDELSKLDYGEVECLRDEIESWKSNLEGTNLEASNKYQMLSDAYDALESGVSSLEGIDTSVAAESKDDLVDTLEERSNEIEQALSELENVEFPGMFS